VRGAAHAPVAGKSIAKSVPHIPGLDSLRFLCALWVLFSHAGGVPLEYLLHLARGPVWLLAVIHALDGIAFDGVAAVMMFFIVSGFCIHLPFHDVKPRPVPFLVRRSLRIGIPLFAAIGCAYVVTGRRGTLEPVLWSLYCELIYYALYPVLSGMASRTGWIFLLCSSAIAALFLATRPDTEGGAFWAYGPGWTWVLGLPIWLTGVVIAEKAHLLPTRGEFKSRLWFVRTLVWICSALAVALHFHSFLHYKITMLLFCPLGAVWFLLEVKSALLGHVSQVLEAAGRGSYSLYLCHLIALRVVEPLHLEELPRYFLGVTSALCFSACFYFLFEKPAHQFAKRLSRNADLLMTPAGRINRTPGLS